MIVFFVTLDFRFVKFEGKPLFICLCRNNLIRTFKFEHNVLTVYAKGDLKNCADVKDFVDTYFRRDIFTQVVVG